MNNQHKSSVDNKPIESFPAYKRNLQLMKVAVKNKKFQKLAKEYKKVVKEIKNDKRHYFALNKDGAEYFLPEVFKEQSARLNRRNEILDELCSHFPRALDGSSHFEMSVITYALWRKITAPHLNVVVSVHYDKKGRPSTPTPIPYGHQYTEDKKEAEDWVKVLSEGYPATYNRSLRKIKSFSKYEKIEKWDNDKDRQNFTDIDGSNPLRTYKDLAKENVGFANSKNDIIVKKEHQKIRQRKSRMKKHLKRRNLSDFE